MCRDERRRETDLLWIASEDAQAESPCLVRSGVWSLELDAPVCITSAIDMLLAHTAHCNNTLHAATMTLAAACHSNGRQPSDAARLDARPGEAHNRGNAGRRLECVYTVSTRYPQSRTSGAHRRSVEALVVRGACAAPSAEAVKLCFPPSGSRCVCHRRSRGSRRATARVARPGRPHRGGCAQSAQPVVAPTSSHVLSLSLNRNRPPLFLPRPLQLPSRVGPWSPHRGGTLSTPLGTLVASVLVL
jgi:hypothetical protein